MQMMRNLFVYFHAKNYQRRAQFCKVIVKRKGAIFLAHRVHQPTYSNISLDMPFLLKPPQL